uniref:S1 motif domain-containing protein n=1 Tax=Chrysotila carterae TaxID=13221 RepID=A0A7S4AXM1_CHRCT
MSASQSPVARPGKHKHVLHNSDSESPQRRRSSSSRSQSPPPPRRGRSRSRSCSRSRERDRSGDARPVKRRPDDRHKHEHPRRSSRSSSEERRARRTRDRSRERERLPPPPAGRNRERAAPEAMPAEGSIHEGSVVAVKPFGAFVQIDGFRKHGLVHISQLAPQRVEAVEDVVREGERVKVKVLSSDAPEKLSLSMKQVDQRTGDDLGDGGGGQMTRRQRAPVDSTEGMTWGLQPLEREEEETEAPADQPPKQMANFQTTGKLAEATNKVNGVVLKWSEPHDAMKPSKHWRLYVFKGKEELEPYHIHRQTAYLLGRERRVADIPLDHPSCSSQHAVLQARQLTAKRDAALAPLSVHSRFSLASESILPETSQLRQLWRSEHADALRGRRLVRGRMRRACAVHSSV